MAMKTTHWFVVTFVLIGALYVGHLVMNHGGVKAGLSGLGINR